MLGYSDLSPAQRKYVDLLEMVFPDVYNRGTITFREIKDIHKLLVAKREEHPGYKCAEPLWMITYNAIQRGTYKIPKRDEQSEEYQKNEFDLLYESELKSLGIKPKPTRR